VKPAGEALLTAAGAVAVAGTVFRRTRLRVVAPVVAAAGGALAGRHRMYRWSAPSGWAAFALDATWNLGGTLGGLAMALLQTALGNRPDEDMTVRSNALVYASGPSFAPEFALTWGTAVSNAAGRAGLDPATISGRRRRAFVRAHELLHVWQQRWLGPLYPVLYGSWVALGALAGVVVWASRDGDLRATVLTLAYYDNPFEYWAYVNDGYWPPAGAAPGLAWPPRAPSVRTATGR